MSIAVATNSSLVSQEDSSSVLRNSNEYVNMNSTLITEISYLELVEYDQGYFSEIEEEALLNKIEKAFGQNGLGILTVSDIPGYEGLRKKVLHLSQRLATLSESQKEEISDPSSNWCNGWSHGVEKLNDGTPDHLKGSFYANPNYNNPVEVLKAKGINMTSAEIDRNRSYTNPNRWPTTIPELETTMLELGTLITDVGVLLAKACDMYIKRHIPEHSQLLHKMIEESVCNKARLLHYFPPSKLGDFSDSDDPEKWCGVHCDHSILTGLCKAIFLTPDYEEVVASDPNAGLYVENRAGRRVKINIPDDQVGFQIGQVAQLVSNNFLQATPHLVKAPSPVQAKGKMKNVSRNTLAVFMQPGWNQELYTGLLSNELIPNFNTPKFYSGMSFGEFTEAIISYHNSQDVPHSRL